LLVYREPNMVKELFTFIAAPITQWLENRGEIKKAQHERELAVINNQARLAKSEQEFNHQWEMESLKGNSPWLRVIVFIQLAIPFNVAIISPDKGKVIFDNLTSVPEWYVQMYLIVIGSVWGVSEFKKAAPGVIAGIAKAVRREN
jgi:hypothetical protein